MMNFIDYCENKRIIDTKFIDKSVYSRFRMMRMIHCQKINKNNHLVLDDVNGYYKNKD